MKFIYLNCGIKIQQKKDPWSWVRIPFKPEFFSGFISQLLIKLVYSQTCIKRPRIKRSPSIKRSVVKVPKIYLNVTSFKRSPLLSGRGHPLQSPSEGISIVFTCIYRSLHKRKPYERALNVVILAIKSSYFLNK